MSEAQTTPPLVRDPLLAEAQRRTGLQDIGDTWFFEPLDAQIASLTGESQLTEQAKQLEAERIVDYLSNRLRRVALIKAHPEILDEKVHVAATIISLARTGSTKSH